MSVIEIIIPNRPIVKKNTSYKFKGRHLYSKRFYIWERDAGIFVRKAAIKNGLIKDLIHVDYEFYFKNHQGEADLSNLIEGPQDCLEKFGLIKNDKQIYSLTAKKFFNEEPRTIIKIGALHDQGRSSKTIRLD